jgi:endonuclease/exonuclease/phosphatase family metal-dependent hydrolase
MNQLTIASLNTRGMPVLGSRLRERYGVIAREFEDSDVDVVNFQEVLTYYHLRQLVRWMPSYLHVSYRRSAVGPAGGLVTFARRPVEDTRYFPLPAAGLAGLKGALVTRLPPAYVVNTHPQANVDGDWSESNRFYRTHREQLTALADIVDALPGPAIVCGDFNVPRESDLFRDFISKAYLIDAFAGACPPTFHAAYLPPGRTSQCIDFVLVTGAINVQSADLMFTTPPYVSDHLGLRVSLLPT